MDYIAHIRHLGDGTTEMQPAADHCRNTAEYAGKCLKEAGLVQAGYLAGLLHDAGKCKREFQSYILEGNGKRGSVNHTFAGCRMLLEHFHGIFSERFEDAAAELLAYAVGAHHGLFDCVDTERTSGFLHRMEKENIQYEESRDAFLACCAGWKEIEERFQSAAGELSALFEKLLALSDANSDETREEFSFYLGLTARLLTSAVIEGDRRDTAAFMHGELLLEDEKPCGFWDKYLQNTEEKLALLPNETTVQKARVKISDKCRRFAEKPAGVYRLHVPTGGGKTLSSLRYALAHAARWGKKRIIFVTPLLAILEQNARVIREHIGDGGIILEHHSNVIQTENTGEDLDLRELAVESWRAPVVLTTMAQFLNTLFLGKTTSVRRFQSLCDAVIVIDEVQTVPSHMLTLFNLTVNYLAEVCRTTFLLCSATQPCFEQADHPLLRKPSDVVPFDQKLWEPFARTSIMDAGRKRLEEIPGFIREILSQTENLLVVCNKKSEAEFLYRSMNETTENCFHLSASMCAAHRRETLEAVYQALNRQKGKVLCVATQVIEAGVDISFQRVIRLAAGMDSIVQSAGRCNRNGEEETPSPVYVVQCADENLGKLQEIQRAKTVTVALLEEFRKRPEFFQKDLSSDEAVRWYYRRLYAGMEAGFQDYPLLKERDTLFSMLGSNTRYYADDCGFYGKYSLTQAFRTAGGLFRVFDESTTDAVVPYGEGEALLAELEAMPNASETWLKHWSRRARPYTIALYEYQKKLLGCSLRNINGVWAVSPEAYDSQTGLSLEQKSDFLEV